MAHSKLHSFRPRASLLHRLPWVAVTSEPRSGSSSSPPYVSTQIAHYEATKLAPQVSVDHNYFRTMILPVFTDRNYILPSTATFTGRRIAIAKTYTFPYSTPIILPYPTLRYW
ncbi:hypothetical protein EYF80_018591 [Liparis tanakae]|uniref:Uncharacterized protein n=1 Tax=Liparis tanakae TaxID=230148 RepID=A0A4Z2I1X3_9TELE|nr:hypothetical protein EYF80_018591 [Liparis tanakae]